MQTSAFHRVAAMEATTGDYWNSGPCADSESTYKPNIDYNR